ncbi:zinc finger, CCHC-type containing protein [Tanacetum coccineum]
MYFLLSNISVVYVLTTLISEDDGDDAIMEQIRKRAKWDNDDYVCRCLILNGMSDFLFGIYQNVESSKVLYDSLKAKYMAEDATSKKFFVSNFTNYKMTDSRPVMKQYNELLNFKHTLKHRKEELTLVELGSHLHIEESLKAHDGDKPKGKNVAGPQLNIVNDNITSAFMSTSKLNDSILWHARLGHVYFKIMQDISKDALIPAFDMDAENYQCDMHANLSLSNKKNTFDIIDELRGLSQGFWGEAMLIACYLLNRVPNKRNMITPYELWTKRKPNLNYLRVWGCKEVVRLPDPKLKTLGERGIKCIFVGYAEHSSFSFLFVIEPNEPVSINSIIESRYVIFDENIFSSVPRPSLRIPNGTGKISDSWVLEEVTEEEQGMRSLTNTPIALMLRMIPRHFDEAMKSHDVAFLKEAINDEMDSIMGNNTWVLADLPLCCKWIYKRKLKVDGTIEKFKARLVIQGFRQKLGIDYFDTYAPVARISTIILLIAMTSIHNMIIHHMDVKATFLNGELDEEVYINQPQGFIMPGNENKVDLTKEFLSSKFSMKEIGEADVIMGIRIKHESNKIAISQSHYIEKAVSQLEYSRMIGCLMYAMTCTRPDIAFAMGKLSRLTYTGYPSVLEGYTNASWISNTKDNSSTSGWVFLLGGGAISWASKKQTCITGSTIESEFVALAAAGKKAEWLEKLLLEIPLWSKPIPHIFIRCDSAATLAKAYSQMYNGKSRHLGVRHSMIREPITNGVVSIEFVRSQQNLANHLTKALARDLVIKSAERTGLKSN